MLLRVFLTETFEGRRQKGGESNGKEVVREKEAGLTQSTALRGGSWLAIGLCWTAGPSLLFVLPGTRKPH